MTDFDSIWRTQDEIRTVVDAVLGECIWDLSFNERRMAIELELTKYLEEEDADCMPVSSAESKITQKSSI